jgi:hypothetical protein
MKFRKPISSWLLFAWMVGPLAVAQIGPATGRALLISDAHLDPLEDALMVKGISVLQRI